ncbi:putative membrane protein YdjX (TVP38/TMEM64 family) [Alicyclobacillus sacchari]|uniref:TVP38/TMEM64 family membrane protein n=2 Tax=Alicyclobacillus sacchari TaxID=392010 RepID=A0A4R8LNL9_9BACL|nr:VTT domain-containing protein [Alicyclobacillus sacchari]TDY47878.1 putative membrane protein YdjX (TVP38/TMEM64 family) [Alicyclobacillus sacchari]
MAAFIKQLLTDWRTISMIVLGAVMAGVVLYLDRNHRLTELIQSWGFWGIIYGIILMVIWCLTPIPSEGLLIIFLRVFGVLNGTAYAWIGSTISSVIIYFIARHFTRIMLGRVASHERFDQVNLWVREWGSWGLLLARLLPVPAFVVNYVAGMIPAITLWSYTWTAVVAMLPYYLGVALVYAGVFGNWIYIIIGCIPLGALAWFGTLLRKRASKSSRSPHDTEQRMPR